MTVEEKNLNSGICKKPNDLDCIDTNLWLGNMFAATDIQVLEENKIKFILTVNSFPLPEKILCLSYVNKKYIKVFDTSRDDLLSHFEETYEFIETSVKSGAVLVHCFHGVSRSPTIITSYLMKKKNMTMKAALDYVTSKRESVAPNPGFLSQLKLFEIMHCFLDRNNVQYKMFQLYITAEYVKKGNVVPENYVNVIKPDPILTVTNGNSTVYRCKKCRVEIGVEITGLRPQLLNLLANTIYTRYHWKAVEKTIPYMPGRVLAHCCNVIPHKSGEKYSWRNSRWSNECLTEICQLAYFIEPLKWMKGIVTAAEGKLHCPNTLCNNKLGTFSWITGCQCPCGTHVCPGFNLIPSKVDKIKIDFSSKVSTVSSTSSNKHRMTEQVE